MKGRFFETRDFCWEDIAESARAGKARSTLRGGERLPVRLSGGEIEVEAAYDESGTLFFVYRQTAGLCAVSRNGCGGWADSELRRLAASQLQRFPKELRSLMAERRNAEVINGEEIAVRDRLFCLSAIQVTGERGYAGKNPGDTQLSVFRDPANRARASGYQIETWWTRTRSGADHYICVSENGRLGTMAPFRLAGVIFAFTF